MYIDKEGTGGILEHSSAFVPALACSLRYEYSVKGPGRNEVGPQSTDLAAYQSIP